MSSKKIAWLPKTSRERYQTFLKNKRKRSNHMMPKDKTNLPKKEEQKLGEYIKSYYNMRKNLLYFKYKP